MSDEFSKLSIKSKSTISCQNMMWVIPQSRLNQQCPFLEQDYPYFTTDFSMLHHANPELELKWKLILERNEDLVMVSLANINDKIIFDRKEMKNVEVRLKINVKSDLDQQQETESTEDVPTVAEDFQNLRFGQSKGIMICSVDSFESLSVAGKYNFDVTLEVEYFQQPRRKFSLLQQAKWFSASISDISTKTRQSISSGLGVSSPSRSWIGKTLPNLRRASFGRQQRREEPGPSYQPCSVPVPPSPLWRPSSPSCPPAFYNYRQSGHIQLADGDVGGRYPHLEVDHGACKPSDEVLNVRRTKSGRLPSCPGDSVTKADDTLDSRVSSTMDLNTVGLVAASQCCPHPELDNTYSSIPDNVFVTPVPPRAAAHPRHHDGSPSAVSQASSILPAPLQRCASTPNPAARSNIYGRVHDRQTTPFNNFYDKITPLGEDSAVPPGEACQRRHQSSFCSVSNKNFMYATVKHSPGVSPYVKSVKLPPKRNLMETEHNIVQRTILEVDDPNTQASKALLPPRMPLMDNLGQSSNIIGNIFAQTNELGSVNSIGVPYSNNDSQCSLENCKNEDVNMKFLLSGYVPDMNFIRREKRTLLELAVKNGLRRLLFKCEEAYLESLEVRSCLEMLLVFDNVAPRSIVRQKIIIFIRENLKIVSLSKNWCQFSQHCPVLVTEIMSTNMQMQPRTLII